MHNRKILLYLGILILSFFTVTMISPKEAYAAAPITNRLSGMDRYETNIAITKNGWTEASNIVIASGEDFPDALCAAPLAKVKNAPIILSQKGQLNNSTIDEIKRLKAKNAYIIGGTGVISVNIEKQLTDLGITWVRLAGQNRYQTSVKVAELLGTNNGIVVATGENFPDALGIAPVSAKLGMPILLSPQDSLPGEVSDYLKGKSVPASYVVGGTGVLSDKVKSSLNNAKRLSGSDRYDTNINILKEFSEDLDFTSIYAASGSDFPDALSGSVLAANSNSPIVLVSTAVSQNTSDYLKGINCRTINILGGTGAVSAGTENSLKTIMKYLTITRADDISDIAFINEDYHFPDNVLVAYDDSTTKLVPVKWDSNSLDTSKPGSHSFEGTISGYSGKVKLNTKVIAETGSINGNHANGGYVAYYKGDIYYSNIDESLKIYKYGKNGLPHTKLSDGMNVNMNIVNDWIYYREVADDNKIYRMKLDGSGKVGVTNGNVSGFIVVGDWIYYSYNNNGTSEFYMMKTDGTNKTKLSSDNAGTMAVYDGYIYYTNISDGYSIWKIKLDGSGRSKVSGDKAYYINAVDNWIYYHNASDNGKLYKIKTDGTGRTKLADDIAGPVNVYNGWVYYRNDSDNDKFYRIRTDGTSRSKFVDISIGGIMIVGEYIFYLPQDGSSSIRMVRLDGSSDVRFTIPFMHDMEPNDSISSISTAANYPLSDLNENTTAILGSLDKDDSDLYRVEPDYSGDLNIVLTSSGIGSNAVITMLDENGTPFGSLETNSEGMAAIRVTGIVPGTYYIKVSSKQGSTPGTNQYQIIGWLERY